MNLVGFGRSSLLLLLLIGCPASLVAAAGRAVTPSQPPAITGAFIDADAGEVSVIGERFMPIQVAARMRLGTVELSVIAATDTVVTARLPQSIADGIYRLEVITPRGSATLDVTLSLAVAATTQGVDVPGPPGPKGDKGDKGDAGERGIPGSSGAASSQGPAGPQGLTGATGASGATGPQGAAGTPSAAGPPGAPGAPGLNGAQGATGSTGPVGATGAAGPQGPIGATGATGQQGAPGLLDVNLITSDIFQGDPGKEETTRGEALCPDKSVVIGGGAQVELADGNWALQESFPFNKPQLWQVHYVAIDGTAKQIAFRVYALCVASP